MPWSRKRGGPRPRFSRVLLHCRTNTGARVVPPCGLPAVGAGRRVVPSRSAALPAVDARRLRPVERRAPQWYDRLVRSGSRGGSSRPPRSRARWQVPPGARACRSCTMVPPTAPGHAPPPEPLHDAGPPAAPVAPMWPLQHRVYTVRPPPDGWFEDVVQRRRLGLPRGRTEQGVEGVFGSPRLHAVSPPAGSVMALEGRSVRRQSWARRTSQRDP